MKLKTSMYFGSTLRVSVAISEVMWRVSLNIVADLGFEARHEGKRSGPS